MKAERRTIAPGTARKPASRKRFSPQSSNFDGTLSHHCAPPGPPLIGAIVAITFILTSVKLPTFVNSTLNYLGSMTTPLAMLFIGIAIYIANLRTVRLTKDMWVLVAARFLIAPAVVMTACWLYPVPELMRKVFIIEAAMPVMTQVSIAARAYKADANYVAVMTAVTTVMALFTIPTYFILLTFGFL